jgi:PAS domain S-box-containing protein
MFIKNMTLENWDRDNTCLEWVSQILEKIQNNIFVYSVDWICLYTNKHLRNILNINPIGKHLSEIFPHRSQDYINNILIDYKKIRNNQKWDVVPMQEEKFSNGEIHIFSVTREPIIWNGHPAIAGIGKDITDIFMAKKDAETTRGELILRNKALQEINSDLIEAKKKLENFMKHVTHDIKWPICSIIWYIDFILDSYSKKWLSDKENENIKNFLSVILDSWESILSFIEDLSDFSNINEVGIKLNYKNINMKLFFDRLKKQWDWYLSNINSRLASSWKDKKNIDIIIDQEIDNNFVLKSDPMRLERILTNLVNNAIKFTENWYISIKLEEIIDRDNNPWYLFQISDSWIWIDQSHYDLIFQEFGQIDSQIQIKWTGLGLSIVKKAIDCFWWYILPLDSKVWEWTVFRFVLPVNK